MTRIPLEYHIGTQSFYLCSQTKDDNNSEENDIKFLSIINLEFPFSDKFYESNLVTIININYLKETEEINQKFTDLKKSNQSRKNKVNNYEPFGKLPFPLGIGTARSMYKHDDTEDSFIIVSVDRVIVDYYDYLCINHPVKSVLKDYHNQKHPFLGRLKNQGACLEMGRYKRDDYYNNDFYGAETFKPELSAVTGHVHNNGELVKINNDSEVFSEYEYEMKELHTETSKSEDLLGAFIQLFRKEQERLSVTGTQYLTGKNIAGIIIEPLPNFYSSYFEITNRTGEGNHNRLGFFTTLKPDINGVSESVISNTQFHNLVYYLDVFEKSAGNYNKDSFITNLTTSLTSSFKN